MGEESAKALQANELEPIEFYEPTTAGGCARSFHIELTLGKGKFEAVECPVCRLEVYRP